MTIDTLSTCALDYLRAHDGQFSRAAAPLLAARCIEHLVNTREVSHATAHVATLQALGELEARHSKASIDCNRTTSFTLFLTDENGKSLAFTAAELLRLARLAYPLEPTLAS